MSGFEMDGFDDKITVKDIRKYFGDVQLGTSFYYLCSGEDINKYLKVNKYYWKDFTLTDYELDDGTKITGLHKIRINYKRSGIIFWTIPEYGKKFKEQASGVYSVATEFLCPEIISKKQFGINPLFKESDFDTLGGRIKIVD